MASGTADGGRLEQLLQNAILRHLPERELSRLVDLLEVVDGEIGHEVHRPGEPITSVYFPLTSVYSLVAVADERSRVEVATIGLEGMVGLPLFLGANSSPHSAFCQIPGSAARLGSEDLRRVLTDDGVLHRLLNRLTQATMVQVAQNVVCNNSHDIEQRAARWLLTTHDRVQGDVFSLTQEFLARMLGARRPTVSSAARRLQDRGLLSYVRGTMRILDRPGLETLACPCYAIVRREFDAMTDGTTEGG
jgi:CRP-like cAMP-binding protein